MLRHSFLIRNAENLENSGDSRTGIREAAICMAFSNVFTCHARRQSLVSRCKRSNCFVGAPSTR